jgi:hypothetical protein
LESQRVKLLIEGYLRGWLDFKYEQGYSRVREDLILYTMEQEHYADVLRAKLLMDAALVGGASNKTATMLNGLEGIYQSYLGLKLPDLAPKTTIKSKSTISKESIQEMKMLLDNAKKKASSQPTSK